MAVSQDHIFKKEDNAYVESPLTIIKSRSGWRALNLGELVHCRDLLYFLVSRDIKGQYAQTILGLLWAVLEPVLQIVIFTVIFGKVAKINTEGIPYALFATAGIIPWSYLSKSMTQSSLSLVSGQHMLSKVYFPRLIYPLISIVTKLVDFGLSIMIFVVMAIYYGVVPTLNLLLFPLFVLYMVAVSAAFGLWTSSMAIRFRDVKHSMTFVVRMLMFSAPIVYSASTISETHRFLYSLNPIVGVIEGFRACLLGVDVPWQYIWPGTILTIIVLISGAYYFKRMERIFSDVI